MALGWGVMGLIAKAEDDPAAVVYWVKPRDVISKDATEAQQERKQAARADLDLESSMREKGYFLGWDEQYTEDYNQHQSL